LLGDVLVLIQLGYSVIFSSSNIGAIFSSVSPIVHFGSLDSQLLAK